MKEKVIALIQKVTKLNKKEVERLLEIPPSQEMGDFSFPCFNLAKNFKKNPKNLAQELSHKLKPTSEIESIKSVGPYINFYLNQILLTQKTLERIKKEKNKYGSQRISKKVLIESPGPNTNKPLHLGHARNIILGQSISNLLSFSGNEVINVNINNDKGIHICKSMVAYEKFGKKDSPKKENRKPDHFVGDYYVKFAKEFADNPDLENEVRLCLQNWEKGEKKTISLWKKMNSWAYEGFKETYKKFNLKIHKNYYESELFNKGKKIIYEQYKKGNVEKKDNGAYFVNLAREGLGEKILIRGDGTSIYITQDVYLAILRYNDYKFDKLIYVTAVEQNYHFKTLFTILKKFGYKWADKLYHLNYGMINLESGRMKSREGTVVDTDDLIENLTRLSITSLKIRKEVLSKSELEKRASTIAMSAIRYYFLRTDRINDIVFNEKEAISFEGNTGPYLLYTYARSKSILRKAKYNNTKLKIKNLSKIDKSLIKHLSEFPDVIKQAYNNLAPNIIANYTYQLAKLFNEFYHSTKVLGSENEIFRLELVFAVSQVLKNSLSILCIDHLEKM